MKKVFLILLLGMFMISFSSAGVIDDIVNYLKLDDNLATTNVIDSLSSNDGTLEGGSNTVDLSAAGIIDLSLNFVAANEDKVDMGFISQPTTAFTVSLWFNADIIPTTESNSLVTRFKDAGDERSWLIGIQNNKVHAFSSNDGTWQPANTIESGTNISTGQWYNVIYRYNGTHLSLWVNGTQTDQIAFSSDLYDGTASTQLAHYTDGPTNQHFDGRIDEVGTWNRSLTDSEILELWNSGNGLSYPFGNQSNIFVELNYPEDNEVVSSSINFTSTLTPSTGFNLTNATLFIWDSDDNLFFTETNLITGNESNSTIFLVDNLTVGNYKWNVFGEGENSTTAIGNFSSSNFTFIWIPFKVDNEEFTPYVFETSRQEFLLNITTLSTVLSIDAILNYNGTRFTAQTSCVSSLCEIQTAIDIQLVSAGESQNKSFFWEISVFDGTNSFTINLSSNVQNITRLRLEKCNATYTVQTFNFTSFDEATQDAVNPFMFDGSFDFWLGTGSIKRNNSISESSISSLQLCLTPSEETLFLDGTIEYDEATDTNYTNRNYFFQNDQISNVSQDIRLGLLLSEDSTSFILKVQDRDILPVANVVIFTERFYPGEGVFKTVQVSQTDDSGGTIGFFKTETVDYRFILKQNGTTVLTTNKQKIIGESVPFTLTFTIGADEGAAWDTFEDIDDLTSSVYFNKTSNIVSFTYADTSDDFTLGRLIVEKVNASGLQNTIICSETSIESSAIITCNLTGNSTGTYIMRGIITRDSDPILVVQEPFAIEDFSMVAGRLGLFLGWFIILISAFAFKFNEVAGIILVNLAMIMVNLFGLISFGYVFISAIIAISIIILVVLER